MSENTSLISLRQEAISKFDAARTAIAELTQQCNNIVIVDTESLQIATSLAKNGKRIEDLIENKRKEITAPILDEKKQIDDHAKSLIADLNKSVSTVRTQILNYEKKQRQIAEEARLALLEKQRLLEEELRNSVVNESEEDLSAKSQQLSAMKEKSAELMQAPASKTGTTISKIWTFDIIDENLVPVQYMSIDEKKIKEAIRKDVREIPGVKIYQKENLMLR
jgi:hypothetical protein